MADSSKRYQSAAEENQRANAAAYKAWVETHPIEQIHNANKARNLLKNKYNIPKGYVKLIKDERQPKRPVSAYSLFTKARWSSGDFSTGVKDSSKAIGQEWNNLSESDKQVSRVLNSVGHWN
jgi:hypothetical protein